MVPRGLAVALVVAATFTALGGAGYALSTQVAGLASELPKYRDNIRDRIADLRGASRGGAIEHLQSTARDVMAELDKEGGPSRRPFH